MAPGLRLILTLLFAPAFCLGAPAALRVAAFNLEWLTASADETRMDPWEDEESLATHRRDLARILADKVRADVVCVLEATSRGALEKLLAEPALGPLGYRIYHLESEDTGTGQDVAFLSRLPVDRVGGLDIRRFPEAKTSGEIAKSGRGKKRGKPAARLTKHAVIFLRSGNLKLGILGIHLLAHPGDPRRDKRREAQAKIASDIVRKEIVARGYTPVVLGDFNDFDPDLESAGKSPARNRKVLRLVKDYDRERPGNELFNAAERIPLAERYSAYWDKNGNRRRDVGEPISLLDHVLLDQSLSPRLIKAEIPHDAQDGSVSDHWPMVVELQR